MTEYVFIEPNPEVRSPAGIAVLFDEPRGDQEGVIIPMTMLGSFMELLGYTDVEDGVQACYAVLADGELAPDPDTGENSWTEVYELLSIREKAREKAVQDEIEADAHNPRSKELVGLLGAYQVMPGKAGEKALDVCREKARKALRAPEPGQQCEAARGRKLYVDSEKNTPEFCDFIQRNQGHLQGVRQAFLHSLTGNPVDPLTEPEPEPVPLADQTRARYGLTERHADA